MPRTLAHLIASIKTSQLIEIKNKLSGEKPIKKFATRGAAEKAVLFLLPKGLTVEEACAFFLAKGLHISIQAGVPEPPAPAPPPAPPAPVVALPMPTDKQVAKVLHELNGEGKAARAPKAAKASKAPGKSLPMLNLRCPHCGYFAKTLQTMLAKARLACPVSAKHGILKTAEERGEKRGR